MEPVRFVAGPTPVDPAPRLARALGLGADDLVVKREDLIGVGGEGNKVRKLEVTCGQALDAGADVLLTSRAPQSNHARASAAGARLGLPVVLVLLGREPAQLLGNLTLDMLFGAQVVWAGDEALAAVATRTMVSSAGGPSPLRDSLRRVVSGECVELRPGGRGAPWSGAGSGARRRGGGLGRDDGRTGSHTGSGPGPRCCDGRGARHPGVRSHTDGGDAGPSDARWPASSRRCTPARETRGACEVHAHGRAPRPPRPPRPLLSSEAQGRR
jgi:hypothetical protein